jgi:hypothetical protein
MLDAGFWMLEKQLPMPIHPSILLLIILFDPVASI